MFLYKYLLFSAFIVFIFINTITLNDGHNWGDDFAQYILHAINLVEHRPYTENIALDLWTVVPPGFPLILSAIIYWIGVNFKILKFLNIFFWALTALAGYFIAVKRLKPALAATLTIWFLSAPLFFVFKQNVLSDIPFLCFVSLSIWAFMQYEGHKSERQSKQFFYVVAVILMSYSVLIRWVGIVLPLSAVLYLCINKEGKKSLGFILGACISLIIGINIGSKISGHFDPTLLMPGKWLYLIWMNIAYLPNVLLDVVITQPHLSKTMGPAVFIIFKFIGPVIFGASIAAFFYKLSQRKISFLGCFTFFYILGMILWPVQQGMPRYVLPIIIPLMVYFLSGVQMLWKRPGAEKCLIGFFIILIVQNVKIIEMNWKFNDDNLFRSDTLEMANWVIDNIQPDEHYLFFKPRALELLTKRTGASFGVFPEDQQFWYRKIKPLHIQYLICNKYLYQFAQYNEIKLVMDNEELGFDKVWENSKYKIFKLK